MFETAELGNQVAKRDYKQQVGPLRAALVEMQRQLAAANFSVVLVISGLPTAGKSETVNKLLEWLDARGIETHAQREPTDEERQRPPMWRFWRALPPAGKIGIFFGGWDGAPFLRRVMGKGPVSELDYDLDAYVNFERMLLSENVLLVKIWLHLPEQVLHRHIRKLQNDPATAWRVTRLDRKLADRYSRFLSHAEHLITRTAAGTPWHLVEATDTRYRHLTVGRILLEAIAERLTHEKARLPHVPTPVPVLPAERNVINTLDLTLRCEPHKAKKRIGELQAEIARLKRKLRSSHHSLVLVFEGPDAAGKGGAIRRLTQAMDARDYQVISVAAPTDEEKARPYLWRFWRHLPPHGRTVIYDRSWYGRVLVERVEGFASEDQWQRAYGEIDDFEMQLTASGCLLMKFWLAISPEEQLRRFEQRETTPYKQYKITPEDWRNREKWASYEAAACDMIERTSTLATPWLLIEAEDKSYARVKVLTAVVNRLKRAVNA
ncbi:MAG: polyphosphate:AMP phosphotransferase [Planctomycetia bacterium]|nr:polyphosphate:AMP phosphotransferase [Planctomycetia bacterium]